MLRAHLTTLALAGTATIALAGDPVNNVHVVDPATATIAENQTILVSGWNVGGVHPANGDWSGLYAVPALIDAHVHYALPDIYGPLFIAHGVALVRDLGGETEQLLTLREDLNTSQRVGPSMRITGRIIDGDPAVWPFSYPCDEPEDGREAVRELQKQGVDYIKVYSRLSPGVFAAVCDEADKLGMDVIGHIPNTVPVQDAIAAGMDTAEHMLRIASEFVDEPRPGMIPDWWWNYEQADPAEIDAFCAQLAESGLVICPTLVVNYGIEDAADGSGAADERMRFIPEYFAAFWEGDGYKAWGGTLGRTHAYKGDFLRRLNAAGGSIIAGTDLANPFVWPGSGLHEELGHFVAAGIPHAEALQTATSDSAEVLKVSDRYGSIESAKEASFFLTTVNPLEDLPGALANIQTVVHKGEHYDRAELDKLIEQAATAAQAAPDQQQVADLPPDIVGELIHEGRYSMKFGQWDAGHEEFTITKTNDGFRIYSSNRPGGGSPQPPSDSVYYLDNDRKVTKIDYSTGGEDGLSVTYTMQDDGLIIEGTNAGEPIGPEKVELDPGIFPSGPTWVVDYFAADAHGVDTMDVGESVTFMGASFGWAGHRIQKGEITITRLDDAEYDDVRCTVYRADLATPTGPIRMLGYVDEDRITRHTDMQMTMGSMTATLEDD